MLAAVVIGTSAYPIRGQSDAIILGSGWLDQHGESAAAQTLPVPGGVDTYSGQVAKRSQVARTDGNGNLLFFAIDGSVYDGQGYLIADGLGTGCTECIHAGCMEMLAVPAPGHCSLYYLLTSNAHTEIPSGRSNVQVSLLDMQAESDYHECRRGRIIPYTEIGDEYPDLADWSAGLFYSTISNTWVPGWLPLPDGDHKASSPRLRVIDPTGDGLLYHLYVLLVNDVVTYRIDEDGISMTNTDIDGQVPVFATNSPAIQDSYVRGADLAMISTGQIMLAMAGPSFDVWDPATGTFDPTARVPLLVMKFDALTGAIEELDGLPFDGTNGSPDFMNATNLAPDPTSNSAYTRIRACTIVNGGAELLLTGEENTGGTTLEPAIGIWNLATSTWTDLASTFALTNTGALARTRPYKGRYPGTDEESVMIPVTGGLAAFRGTDNTATMTYEPLFALAAANQPPEYDPGPVIEPSVGELPPWFMCTPIVQDGHAGQLASIVEGECCEYRELINAYCGYTHNNANGQYWTATDNYFNDQTVVTFTEDVIIPAGTSLTLTGITWRFGPDAQLTIERGGRLTLYNSILTSLPCEGLRWPGVRVEGDAAQPQGTAQGRLATYQNSRIENAVIGVWCARGYALPLVDPAYGGGRVQLVSSTIRDCIVGVAIQNYHGYNIDGVEQPNASQIVDCTFETTANWPDEATPISHVYLFDVNGVKIRFSRFINQVPVDFPLTQRGWGIQAFDAAFSCTGSNPVLHYFQNLHAGIVASAPDPMEIYRLDGMYFDNNQFGVVDLGSTSPIITNNAFKTLNFPNGGGQLSIGLYLDQSEGYTVERNSFGAFGSPNPSVGIWFAGPTVTENQIYDNIFAALVAGCVVQGRHRTFDTKDKDGLQMLCGDHGGNIIDQWILEDGMIREQQGVPDDPNLTANNQFLSAPDCNVTFDPFVQLGNDEEWRTEYNYFRPPGPLADPTLRPECIETDDDLSDLDAVVATTAEKYTLRRAESLVPFNKTDHCGTGELDPLLDPSVAFQLEQLRSKTAEYKSAYRALWTGLDQGQTNDLIEFMKYAPPHPSHAVRDLLLGHHPLSDSVLLAMLYERAHLDPWHMTQVLIDNSPLSSTIWAMVEDPDVLPVYLYNVLKQFEQGMSTKDLLENEVFLRGQEKARAWNRVLWTMDEDSLYVGKVDTLIQTLSADSTGNWLRNLYWLQLLNNRLAEAADLEDDLLAAQRNEDVLELGQRLHAANGQWSGLTNDDRDKLHHLAFEHANGAGAISWGALLALQELDSLPSPELPPVLKSNRLWRAQQGLEPEPITISAFPNPANDLVRISFEGAVATGELEVFDGQGRQVTQVVLANGKGFVELRLEAYSNGMYLARITRNGVLLGETKFTVAR